MYEMLFHYYPAFVAQVIDASRVRIWLQHPKNDHVNYDIRKTIIVDLDKTPGNSHIQWDDIEVDDYANKLHSDSNPDYGGFTTLGPVTPHHYGAVGIYISLSYRRRHPEEMENALARPRPSSTKELDKNDRALVLSGRPYEELAIVRKEGTGKLRRFHGFHRFGKKPATDSSMVLVAHAATSLEHRARAAVQIRNLGNDVAIFRGSWPETGTSSVMTKDAKTWFEDTNNPVYLSPEVAAEAGLDIPKRPSGSGEGLLSLAEIAALRSDAGYTEEPVPGGPLNVLEKYPYDEVHRIENRLGENRIRVGWQGLGDRLEKLVSRMTFTSLDLIGHSSSRDGILRFDGVPLTAKAIPWLFSPQIIGAIVGLQIRQVRLLGCRTACSPAAREALRALANILEQAGLPPGSAIGTRSDIFAVHYAAGTGFSEERLLVGKDTIVGDAPPYDDEYVKQGVGGYPPTFSPHIKFVPAKFSDLPLARGSSSILAHHFKLRDGVAFDVLKHLVSFIQRDEETPLRDAWAQVLVLDGTDVRSFELIAKPTSSAEPRPEISHIRLNFFDGWYYYEVGDYNALYSLLEVVDD